ASADPAACWSAPGRTPPLLKSMSLATPQPRWWAQTAETLPWPSGLSPSTVQTASPLHQPPCPPRRPLPLLTLRVELRATARHLACFHLRFHLWFHLYSLRVAHLGHCTVARSGHSTVALQGRSALPRREPPTPLPTAG